MIRRSRLEVLFDVLEVIERGDCKPTRIMYGTNLSWKLLQDTLSVLTINGFIREDKKKHSTRYYITNKGNKALSYYSKSLEGLVIARQINSEI